MSSGLAAALLGWIAAMFAGALAGALWRELANRGELIARALHEVRRPLTAARLGLHGLGAGDPEAEHRARAVDDELRRLAFALEDLRWARDGRPRGEDREPIELGELLSDAAVAWSPVAKAFGAEVAVDAPRRLAMIRGDRMRLTQACGNLLANAIEHAGGRIELRGRAIGTNVRIEVVDEGPGLPAPVAQLTRTARAGRGTRGRGLAIASEIAVRHGGRLAAAPAARGARMALVLPTVDSELHGRR
jgi:signal transduction histidine kinase